MIFMDKHRIKKEALEIMKTIYPKHCVIATVSQAGKPECAVMGYLVFNDLTLVFNAENISRKWNNIKDNSYVAAAFGWSADQPFIQYEGEGNLIEKNHPKYQKLEKLYFQEHVRSLQFKELSTSGFILVKPKWIRLTNITVKPHRIKEISL